MTKTNEKLVVLTIDTVRVVKADELNYAIEKYTINDKGEGKWAFKGWAGSIKNALKIIVKREWLLDQASIENLQMHLEQVLAVEKRIDEAIDQAYKEVQ